MLHNISGINFKCPVFTEFVHDVDDGVYTCQYELWFYGLAASLICFGGLLPITLLICCWAKWKNNKTVTRKKLHRQDSDASTHTDLSRPNDHGVYEVLRDGDGKDVLFRTSKGQYHKRYGTFSVPDLRAMAENGAAYLYPEITQTEASESFPATPVAQTPEQPSSEKQIYTIDNKAIPSIIKRKKADGFTKERIDSFLKGVEASKKVEINSGIIGIQNKDKKSTESLDKTEFKKPSELSNSLEKDGLVMRVDTTTPKEIPTSNATIAEDDFHQSRGKHIARSSEDFSCFQPTPPMKHLVDRVDFDQYLCDCVSKLPEDQRNGTFLIRDSQSNEGCKVLTIYFRSHEPGKTLYHYKICFDEEMKVGIPGTKDYFVDFEEFVNFHRKQRTVLPCLLSNCLGKSF